MSKKIAVLCLSHFEGGMEIDALKYTHHFNEFGYDCSLICRQSTFLEEQAKSHELIFHSIEFKRKLDLKLIIGLRKIIQSEKIETIIFFGTSEIKSIFFAVMGLDCKVILRHGTTMSSPKKDPIHKLFYSCVDDFVGISKHLGNNISYIFPCTKNNVKVIYNFSEYTTNISTNKKNGFLFVGRVEHGKGVEDAIIALGKAEIDPALKNLTLVGKYEKKYASTLNDLATIGQVSLTLKGFSNSPELYYDKNQYFLFPSHGEGLGNVILEALSHGLLCICYDNTVFPELKSLGFDNLYLAKNRDTDCLAKLIRDCTKKSFSRNDFNILNEVFSKQESIARWNFIL